MHQPTPNIYFKQHPTQLSKKDRAKYVIQAIKDYNEGIIKNNPQGAAAKFERLKLSPFVFMRGTADLMYRDFQGTDEDKALVLCIGDVHLENFGVMETKNGQLTWGLNDFDEATFAPFTWDVKRGAVSVILAADDLDFSSKKCKKLAKHFIKAYLEHIEEGLHKDSDDYLNTKLIKDLLKSIQKVQPEKWLKKKYLKPDTLQFKPTSEIHPFSKEEYKERGKIIQNALNHYLASLKKEQLKTPNTIKILDLATKTGSGTASIGLLRYFALVEAQWNDKREMIILEIKQMRPSVLAPYVNHSYNPLIFQTEGQRVSFAENIHLPNANPYYGYTTFENINYLVRKRSPFKSRVNLVELDNYHDFKSYVRACGHALAHAHLLSEQAHSAVSNVAKRILKSIHSDDFSKNIADFAVAMAEQIKTDWTTFKKHM